MSSTRREFMKQLGLMLGSLAVSGCAPWLAKKPAETPMITCYAAVVPPETPSPGNLLTRQADILTATATAGTLEPDATRQALLAIGRERLRAVWQQLDALAASTQADYDTSEAARDALAAEHRAVLDDLVAHGELGEAVAGRVQVAFEAAAYHVWRSNAPITCYLPAPIDYTPASSDQLVRQAGLLAGQQDLDPETVARVQAALAREIAFLNMPREQVEALYEEIRSGQQDGQPLPGFEEVDLDLSPQDLAAAQFLLDLLLAGTS